mmetsp:Transcript_7739/g.10691  ORF Transcript_7739/g.10691 Transcript_7739/m.10691 type:complete len:95 (-) Transcript_7739:203-487(-)
MQPAYDEYSWNQFCKKQSKETEEWVDLVLYRNHQDEYTVQDKRSRADSSHHKKPEFGALVLAFGQSREFSNNSPSKDEEQDSNDERYRGNNDRI